MKLCECELSHVVQNSLGGVCWKEHNASLMKARLRDFLQKERNFDSLNHALLKCLMPEAKNSMMSLWWSNIFLRKYQFHEFKIIKQCEAYLFIKVKSIHAILYTKYKTKAMLFLVEENYSIYVSSIYLSTYHLSLSGHWSICLSLSQIFSKSPRTLTFSHFENVSTSFCAFPSEHSAYYMASVSLVSVELI
jgi:hypothetical protein